MTRHIETERAVFCSLTGGGVVESSGGGGVLKVEFFSDKCPSGYALAGNQKKMTTEETLELFAPKDGDAQ